MLLIQEALFDFPDSKFTPPASVSLEHWRALVAVVDAGGYARAAEALGKSQSTVSHGIQHLEELLGTRVLRIEGRRAVLTEVGEVVLRRLENFQDNTPTPELKSWRWSFRVYPSCSSRARHNWQ